MNEALWTNELGTFTRQSYADGLARIAGEKSEWAGLPVPLMGERLVIEKSYYGADKQEEINRITNPPADGAFVCRNEDVCEETTVRNTFWSSRLRRTVVIWQEGRSFSVTTMAEHRAADLELRTLGCADAWSLETEARALETLRTLVTHRAFRQYLLTGQFIETSKRSGVAYLFRRLRPTVAISSSTGDLRILACLCQHPIALYDNSWAGAMTPTDDVLAHLMLMRGDEKLLWKRSNQHQPDRPEAGL